MVPPGNTWPTSRVRTTTSTRTDSPRRTRTGVRPNGPRSAPSSSCTAAPGSTSSLPERVAGRRGSAPAADPAGAAARLADRKDVHRDLARLQELLGEAELLGMLVRGGQRGVGGDEAVRADEAGLGRGVARRHLRHVAVDAGPALLRVVEGAGVVHGHAAVLPGVVLVEAAEPAVGVHRHVQVHLVAAGAELVGLLAHEAAHEGRAVGRGVEVGHRVVGGLDDGVARGEHPVQRRVADGVVALAHRARDVGDRVAGGAAEAGLGLRLVRGCPSPASPSSRRTAGRDRGSPRTSARASCPRPPACTRWTSGTTGC